MNASSKCPLTCRITYNYERKEFSTGLFIASKYWDNSSQNAKPPNDDNDIINSKLSLIKTKINKAFLFLQVKDEPFGVNDIYNQFIGRTLAKEYGLLEYFNIYLARLQKLIGIEIKQTTWDKFDYIKNDVSEFIKSYYKTSDIKLNDLDLNFISEFEYYSKTTLEHQQVTINKSLQRFKKVVKQAVMQKHLESNPFEEHKPKRVYPKIIFLTQEELDKLEKHIFQSDALNKVKDCYLFCCYTGLAYKVEKTDKLTTQIRSKLTTRFGAN